VDPAPSGCSRPTLLIDRDGMLRDYGFFRFSGRLAIWPARLVLILLVLAVSVKAAALDLAAVQRLAAERSFVLKIAASDIALRAIDEQDAESLYLPSFAVRYDLGYAWALDGDRNPVTLGDSVSATDLSTWRNSLSLSGSLLLYDGGAREQKLRQARHGLRAADLTRTDQHQQLRLQVLELYLQGLQSQSRVSVLNRIVELRKRLYRGLKRLKEAGTVGLARLQDASLDLATSITRLDDAQRVRLQALAALTELTGEPYPEAETQLSPLPLPSAIPAEVLPVELLPTVRVFDEELAQLRAEREATWRTLFPSVGFYGNYRWYGANSENSGQALESLSARDATVAMVVQWEFPCSRDRLQLKRLDEQLRRLSWQRQQRIAQLERELGELQQVADLLPERSNHLRTVRRQAADVTQTTDRLHSQGLLDEPEALGREIGLLKRALEEELLQQRQKAEVLRLRIWQEGVGS